MGTTTGRDQLTFLVSYTSSKSYASSAIIHNPDVVSYISTVHIYEKYSSYMILSIRQNGAGLGQTTYIITVGY